MASAIAADPDVIKSLGKEILPFKEIVDRAIDESGKRLDDPNLTPTQASFEYAKVMDQGREKASALLKASSLSEMATDAVRTMLVCMEARVAMKLMSTPRSAAAESTLARCTQVLAENPFQNLIVLQDALMTRAKYWTKKDAGKAIDLLQQAEELYKACRSARVIDPLDPSAGEVSSRLRVHPGTDAQVKDRYAHTLFYLAQIYADQADARMGAYYCGETLALQLEMDVQNHLEWAENCEQMALFHLDRPDLATCQHLLNCAELRVRQAKYEPPDAVKARLASLDLTWAKWFIRQLAESVQEKRVPGSYRPPRQELPDSLRYEQLSPPKPRTLLWDGGLAQTVEDAKEIFNACIRRLRNALEYFDLERHPVIHCNTILDISEAYRCLAEFEDDIHMKCVLHKTRAKRVEPLLQFARRARRLDLVNVLSVDIGNAYREITELKFEEGRPFDKVASAAKEAIPFYEGYLENFRVGGNLPKSIKNKEDEKQYIHTVFYLARVTSRLDPPVTTGVAGPTENLRKAVDLYRYCARFIKGNNMAGELLLAERCLEMATLIQENSEMLRVTKARQRK